MDRGVGESTPLRLARKLHEKPLDVPLQDMAQGSRFPLAPSTERD
jgi:hypothetical protein